MQETWFLHWQGTYIVARLCEMVRIKARRDQIDNVEIKLGLRL